MTRGTTISAPVHRYFIADIVAGLGPSILVLLLDPAEPQGLALVGFAYVVALWVVHLALHHAVVPSMT